MKNKIEDLDNQDIRLKIIGIKRFSKNSIIYYSNQKKKTKKNKNLQINLALNYGSKSEIIYAFKIITKIKKNKRKKS